MVENIRTVRDLRNYFDNIAREESYGVPRPMTPIHVARSHPTVTAAYRIVEQEAALSGYNPAPRVDASLRESPSIGFANLRSIIRRLPHIPTTDVRTAGFIEEDADEYIEDDYIEDATIEGEEF